MPLASVGLLSAQMARSSPDSATDRARATRCWLAARVGSEAPSTENAVISADRMRTIIRAMGRATPRWSVRMRQSVCVRVRKAVILLEIPEPHPGLHGGVLVGVRLWRH